MLIEQEYFGGEKQISEVIFIKRGVSKEILSKLLAISSSREEVRAIVKKFNDTHQEPKKPCNKRVVTLENGREITMYYDQEGWVQLGYGFGLERNAWGTKNPEDPAFKRWLREKHQEFVHTDKNTVGNEEEALSFIQSCRFLQEIAKFLKQQEDVSDEILFHILERIGKVKASIENRGIESGAVEKEIIGGKTMCEVLDNEIQESMGRRFDAHGIAKGSELSMLRKILDDGIDPARPFHTAPLKAHLDVGMALGSNRGGAYADGGFMLLGSSGKKLTAGVALVIVNWQYRDSIDSLSRKYPDVVFTLPEGIRSALEKLSGVADIREKTHERVKKNLE